MTVALVITEGRGSEFTRYLVEVAKTEGINDVKTLEGGVGVAGLAEYATVIVPRGHIPAAARRSIASYVENGGNAVLIRPTAALAEDLGFSQEFGVTDHARVYPLRVPEASGRAIQTHTVADHYRVPADGVVEAWIGADGSHSPFPAVLSSPRGNGRVTLFAYDLPRAIAYIRQGNPDRVGSHAVGAQTRMIDYLLGGHLDPSVADLPQADVHAGMLVHAVTAGATSTVPRWWYYPSAKIRTALVLDSDDDYSPRPAFDALIDQVEALGGHVTMYLMMGPTTRSVLDGEDVQRLRERGHSFGIHHDHYDPQFEGLDEADLFPYVILNDLTEFANTYGDRPTVNRNHCLAWVGYVETARLWEKTGIRMDSNVGSYYEAWFGYANGSGRPTRFVDADGTVIDCFQQAHLIYDDETVRPRLAVADPADIIRSIAWLEQARDVWHHPFVVLSHPVSFYNYSQQFQASVWRAAVERGLPFWSMEEWSRQVDARDQLRINSVIEDETGIELVVNVSSPFGSVSLMIPEKREMRAAEIDGTSADLVRLDQFGVAYVLIDVPCGTDRQQCRVQLVYGTD
jgi:hypothetical protein